MAISRQQIQGSADTVWKSLANLVLGIEAANVGGQQIGSIR